MAQKPLMCSCSCRDTQDTAIRTQSHLCCLRRSQADTDQAELYGQESEEVTSRWERGSHKPVWEGRRVSALMEICVRQYRAVLMSAVNGTSGRRDLSKEQTGNDSYIVQGSRCTFWPVKVSRTWLWVLPKKPQPLISAAPLQRAHKSSFPHRAVRSPPLASP